MPPKKITELDALATPATSALVPVVDMNGTPATKKSTLAQIMAVLSFEKSQITDFSHNLLSASHGDTSAAAAVRGDLIVANSTPAWARKAVGTGVLVADGTDVTGWSQAPTLTTPSMTTPVISTLLNLTAGQIKFPGTQNASSDANTIDDYEEGLWTPVIGGSGGTSGQTYGVQNGRYIKIGKMVWAGCNVQLTNKGTITTNVEIQGLPFATVSSTQSVTLAPIQWLNLNTNWVYITARPRVAQLVAAIEGIQAAAANSNTALTTADILNTTQIQAIVIYEASA